MFCVRPVRQYRVVLVEVLGEFFVITDCPDDFFNRFNVNVRVDTLMVF